MNTSRATRDSVSQTGPMPRAVRPLRVAKMHRRPAAGSRTAPSLLNWLSVRGSLPSSQSESPAKTSRPSAHQSALISTSQKNTGTPRRRARLSAFGTVHTRSGVSPVSVFCRLTVAGLLTFALTLSAEFPPPAVASRVMRWTFHGERSIYTSPWLAVHLADVELPDGRRFEHHLVRVR